MDNTMENERTDDSIQVIEDTQTFDSQVPALKEIGDSESLFPDSPVYEPEDNILGTPEKLVLGDDFERSDNIKRKLTSDTADGNNKIIKLDTDNFQSSQKLDDEICDIINNAIKRKQPQDDLVVPSTSRVRTPVRSSPRKITKRSNSATDVTKTPKTPKTPKRRPGSADITRKTPRKLKNDDSSSSKDDIPIVFNIPEVSKKLATPRKCEPIVEEDDANDSQNLRLVLSPTVDESTIEENNKSTVQNFSSDPVLVKDREEVIKPDVTNVPRSEGYNYSDQSSNLSQNVRDCKGKTTDQESTDSVSSIILDSPENIPTVTSKLISKLSNGNSSTPTELAPTIKLVLSDNESDGTPDMITLSGQKAKRTKNDLFRASNTTTPSTISPLQNGHSLPTMHTPQVPTFEVHVRHNEDGEFLSLYIVRTDNDIGMDLCKEYQRVSKRFTMDPYLGDISSSTSPSSVTSMSTIHLQNRPSFASTVSSSTCSSSNRTSDGAFVVPQPPKKNASYPGSSVVKGYDSLLKKLTDIFSHLRETSIDEANRSSSDDKISVGIQATSPSTSAPTSNGTSSPDEMTHYDRATPKSSLKKTRVRGRRPMTGKTKRAILPTQIEEPEYVLGMNSPEMITFADAPLKSPGNEEKPSVATPKSVSKLKQKRRPTSPRPATPVEKMIKPEYAGHPPNTVVLAKWVDKRYYSGRVIEILEPSKYLIKFDDGKSKPLLDDFIIFGDMATLPVLGKSVFALVDKEQTYEPALVLGIDETEGGEFSYRCLTDGDKTVCVPASGIYLSEDQARFIKETANPKSPPSTPSTPRRRGMRELDLDNIIQGPRSARSRDKVMSGGRKRLNSPKSPKASTSGVKSKPITSDTTPRNRVASESSEFSECSNPPPPRLDDVVGVEPEVQRTPRKIDGVKAGPLQLKGAAKQNIGKKNSKLTKFENDEDTVALLGPIPEPDSKLFAGMHFLLTCTETPKKPVVKKPQWYRSGEETGDSTSTAPGTDCEDLEFCPAPYNRERLREQLLAGGGIVHTHFDEIPKSKYQQTYLIAPRPCLTAKYILCLAASVRALSHAFVIDSCTARRRLTRDAYVLPAGWSLMRQHFVTRNIPNGKRNTSIFKDRVILLCGDQDTFVKFWARICTLGGAITRIVNEDMLNMTDALALVTEWDCPHEVQNKANQDNVPLVSTTWVVQCLVEGRIICATAHMKFSFMYTEPE